MEQFLLAMMALGHPSPVLGLAHAQGDAQRELQLLAVRKPPGVRPECSLHRVIQPVLGLDIEVGAFLCAVEAPVKLLGLVVVFPILAR
jgi:hypothetical protein